MGIGHDHYMRIMTELHKQGRSLTLEEAAELNRLCKEIDRLHQQIIDNQETFGCSKIFVEEQNPGAVLLNGWLKEKCEAD